MFSLRIKCSSNSRMLHRCRVPSLKLKMKLTYISFIVAKGLPFQANVKKNMFPIQRVGKKTYLKLFFCQKLQFRCFLKQPCSFAYCSSFHDVLFIPQKFQCNSTDFHTLHHSQTHFVMKTTCDIKIDQTLLFKIVEFTHLNFFLESPCCLIIN